MAPDLPIHPYLTHPHTGCPLRAVGTLPSGRVIWPILGAADNDEDGNSDNDSGNQQPTWPANTAVENMTAEQQAAYWRHQSQKHQGRATANYALLGQLGVTNAEDAKTAAENLKRVADLDAQNATEIEKREKAARDEAATQARSTYLPQIARAEFKAAAIGRIDSDKLPGILAPFGDMSYFLTDAGEVDTAKVTSYIDSIAPAKGTEQAKPPKGPVIPGHGGGGGKPTGSLSTLSGDQLYDRLHPKKTA